MNRDEFLLPIVKRNTRSDGKSTAPDVLRRMDNPVCRACHEKYQEKYPGKPFNIICQGIYTEEDVKKTCERKPELKEEDVRDILDPIHWAKKHIHVIDDKGTITPFTPRDYQEPVLACSARYKIDRMGRGMGKTLLGVIEELHKITTHKNYELLILCPAKAQAQKWFDDIQGQCDNDPELADCIKGRKQQPYYEILFRNGSKISIFTAGSSSGRGANVIRSQSPRRIRLEEQDLLTEADYGAVTPLLRRYRNTEFHGASTPTGMRSTYWQMCVQDPTYREFYAPITMHPDFDQDYEDACRREARTDDVFRHEFMAEFGDLKQGVFKTYYVDRARTNYNYKQCRTLPGMAYYMGVDWNGQGTGTRIRVVEYNPTTKIRRVVESAVVDGPQTTTQDSLDKIKDMNKYWHCEGVYIDRGFGNVQDEMLRLMGKNATDPDTKRLMGVKVIDFGAEMVTNKLVPNRGNSKYIDKEEEKRRTKPFMVEGAVMCLEGGLFQYSDADSILDSQLRAYRVKTWSQHGFANTYDSGKEGDHDLDALMLALLGVELKYGITAIPAAQRIAHIAHGTLGGGPSDPVRDAQKAAEARQRAEESSKVPSRQMPDKETGTEPKIVLPGQFSHIVIPGKNKVASSRVPSRTAAFRPPGQNSRVPSRTQPNTLQGQYQKPQGNPFDNPFIAPRRGGKPNVGTGSE